MSYPQTINPYSANLVGRAWPITEFFKSWSVLTIVVKVLGMLQHTKKKSPLIELEVGIERLLFSLAVKMPNL